MLKRYMIGVFLLFFIMTGNGVPGTPSQWAQKPVKRPLEAEGREAPVRFQQLVEIGNQLKTLFPVRNTASAKTAASSRLGAVLPALQQKPLKLVAGAPNPATELDVYWNSNGTPLFITGEGLKQFTLKSSGPLSASEIALSYIQANRQLFKLQNPMQELKVEDSYQGARGKFHVHLQQMYQGLPVWGHEIVVHLDENLRLYAINARYSPTPEGLDVTAQRLSSREAVNIALNDLEGFVEIQEMSPRIRRILNYDGPVAKRYVWIQSATQKAHVIWHVEVRPNIRDRWYYFIDAQTGDILEKYNATNFEGPVTAQAKDLNGQTRTINVYEKDGTYFMIDASRPIWQANQPDVLNDPKGALWTLDVRGNDLAKGVKIYQVTSTDNTWSDPVAVSAHYNVGQVFEYFYNVHKRKAIDGNGSTIISIIHVTDGGQPMDNAYWNGAVMAYGDGGTAFKPLAGALDVAAHEMAHGIIERTVNLEYKFQSGALNESFADVFGAMVDRDDWKIGEDVVKPGAFPSGALRDMQNPNNGGSGINDPGWQPAHMNEYVNMPVDQDNGGVHFNSGIPNRVCYLISTAIGRDKAEAIYYHILQAKYLSSQANFVDLRLAAIQAAKDLYGDGNEVNAVKQAFDNVGITGEKGTPPPQDLPPVQGDEWIAVVNYEPGDNSLYAVRPQLDPSNPNAGIAQLTTTQVYTNTANPLSVADDGSAIVFIDAENKLRAVSTATGEEIVLLENGIWASVALSPNARYLALTTIYEDSTIYIVDIDNPSASKAVKLYSPTSQQGVKNYITVYADALDWDLSSRFVLYDAFNRIPQSQGDPLTYWDVNILDIENDLIFRIFPPLPEGISIGNPSFSQTNDNFIVFDFVDFNDGTASIWVADLFNGEAKKIFDNGTYEGNPNLSFAKFSPDDKALVYQRIELGIFNLFQLPLSSDRMSPGGSESYWVSNAIRPYWFAIGRRPTGIEDGPHTAPQTFALSQNYPNPFNPETRIQYSLARPAFVTLKIFDAMGREIALLIQEQKAPGTYSTGWDGRDRNGDSVPSGVYFYQLEIRAAGEPVRKLQRKMLLIR